MSTRYHSIQIGGIFLTHNGLVNGSPCRATVRGLPKLRQLHTGSTVKSANGTPFLQVYEHNAAGLDFTIDLPRVAKANLDSLIDLINANVSGSLNTRVIGTGDTGNFDLNCLPLFPDWLDFPGEMSGSIIHSVKLSFCSVSSNF